MAALSTLEEQIGREFARRVRDRFGQRVLDLRLFGSRARGDARIDSDMDVLVLLDEVTLAEYGEISNIACDLMLEGISPFEVAPRIMTRDQYHRLASMERLLPREIERDGIPL
jgi:predicted nucleotidyltransferase